MIFLNGKQENVLKAFLIRVISPFLLITYYSQFNNYFLQILLIKGSFRLFYNAVVVVVLAVLCPFPVRVVIRVANKLVPN